MRYMQLRMYQFRGDEMVTDENRVVAHFLGGKLAKGYTYDFSQNRDSTLEGSASLAISPVGLLIKPRKQGYDSN